MQGLGLRRLCVKGCTAGNRALKVRLALPVCVIKSLGSKYIFLQHTGFLSEFPRTVYPGLLS